LERVLERFTAEHPDVGEDRLAEAISTAIKEQLPNAGKNLLNSLKAKAPEMLREHRELEASFRERNFDRWREGLDLLQMLVVIAEEAGSDFNAEFRPRAAKENNLVFEAVCGLHARAILVAREVFCLLEGGFADGALARWRSLHEIAVVSGFLSERDNQLAERYLLAREARKYDTMMEYQRHASRTGLEPFSNEEVGAAQAVQAELVRRYGKGITRDYGWACNELGKGNDRVFLYDLEKRIGMDHLRPYFTWACDYTHAGYKPHNTLLGTSESSEPVLLTGQSNSGLAEPAVQVALSLTQTTAALLLLEANFDHLVICQSLLDLVGEVQETFARIEYETLKRARASAETHD